jgi:plastocyanin domain-containing protein
MNTIQIIVILSGIVTTILIAWYFWFAPKAQTRVAVAESGAQEVAITVKGGYTPDVIVVQKGACAPDIHTTGEFCLFRKSPVS